MPGSRPKLEAFPPQVLGIPLLTDSMSMPMWFCLPVNERILRYKGVVGSLSISDSSECFGMI